MLITITNKSLQNGRPTSIGSNSVQTEYSRLYTFTKADFTTNTTPPYSDPENDDLAYLKVLTLPENGFLEINQTLVSVGDLIYAGDIDAENFLYSPENSIESSNSVSFTFDLADSGSQSLSGLEPAVMNILVNAKENQPPSSVGDGAVSTAHATVYTFTKADFTTNTVPNYEDPEGDEPYKLKIITIPNDGLLKINGTAIQGITEITFDEIEAGYLKYEPDFTMTEARQVEFDFKISDKGSEQFIG